MTDVLFRADAGPHIGLGHVQRSLSLAVALRKLGVESFFLTNGGDSHYERIGRFGFPVDLLHETKSWTSADFRATLELAVRHECVAVVVDSHEVGADYLAKLRDAGLFVVARDDLALFPFPCQMVVNGNAGANRLPYRSTAADTQFLLGTEYMVLGPEFEDLPLRPAHGPTKEILVILGGTDNWGLMPKLLNLLNELPGDFGVTAVVGPYFESSDEVVTAAQAATRKIIVIKNPPSIRALIQRADLAISAAGQTLYELAYVGCPTVAISLAPNQRGQLQALEDAGSLLSAGEAETGDVIEGARQALAVLLDDGKARAGMAAAGRQLVDGKGAQRVARKIVEHMANSRLE